MIDVCRVSADGSIREYLRLLTDRDEVQLAQLRGVISNTQFLIARLDDLRAERDDWSEKQSAEFDRIRADMTVTVALSSKRLAELEGAT